MVAEAAPHARAARVVVTTDSWNTEPQINKQKKKYPRRSRPSSRLLAAMDPLCYSCAFFTVVVSEFPEPQQGQQPTDANVFAAVVRIESVVDDVDGVVGVVVLADEGVDGHSAGGHRLAVEHGQTQAGRTSCAPTNTKQKRPLIGCP